MDDVVPSKRLKLEDTYESALNLSLGADVATKIREPNSHSRIFDDHLAEMRNEFQRWVTDTYRDSSKTKTVTTKKYERIVKTLAGEIKNCADNSKFRFWMKYKGFKLMESAPPGATAALLVQDRKGDEIKYKKVAVVENFFDIIYDVHVNEGARGIKHAGQKRTHRTITETYAFLPREAVTKFLLCCVECQKRTTNDERRTSPTSSSCDSVYPSGHEGISITGSTTLYAQPTTFESRTTHSSGAVVAGDEIKRPAYDDIDTVSDGGRNNETPEQLTFSTKIVSPQKTAAESDSWEKESRPGTIRKRKRKITRKIVRRSNVDDDDDNFEEIVGDRVYDRSVCPAMHHYEYVADGRIPKLQPTILKTTEVYTPERMINNFHDSTSQCDNNKCKSNPATVDYKQTNFAANFKNCPYFAKISEILYNPVKYATDEDGRNSAVSNENLLEKRAVDLLLKARRLEQIKDTLTENERRQISLEIYSCRIISFMLNYAADLMLKLTYL